MAFSPSSENDTGLTIGAFDLVENGNHFQFSKAAEDEFVPWPEFPTKVWVTYNNIGGEQGFRWAKVVKTRAYIVCDEAADGSPVVKKWIIRNKRDFIGFTS